MLDLIRLSPSDVRPPGGRGIYRQIALLADLEPGGGPDETPALEVLDVACGAGMQLAYLVREFGVHGSGVDSDSRLIARADARARELGLEERLHFQDAPLDALPYRDEIFDLTIGELGLTSDVDPAQAVEELVRVTKPGGTVVLLQLVWKAPVEEGRRRTLARHLGAQPLMLVEWKRLLKDADVDELHTAEWSDEEEPLRPTMAKPFPEFSDRFSMRERFAILRKAWGLWGWRGLRDTLAREAEVHRLLTRERILGFVLLKGQKALPTGDAGVEEPAVKIASGDLPLFRAPGTADPLHADASAAGTTAAPPNPGGGAAEAVPTAAEIPKPRRPKPRSTSEAGRDSETEDLPLFDPGPTKGSATPDDAAHPETERD